jgi:alcohol dehydrogenase class IV
MQPNPSPTWPDSISQFRFQAGLRGVVAGIGSVEAKLAESVEAQGVTTPMVVCGANLAASPVLDTVLGALGGAPLVFTGSRPHTPVETVDEGAATARRGNVDGLLSVGGSSAVDCAKGIAVLLATGLRSVDELSPSAFGHLSDPFDTSGEPPVPLLMVSTTLSFAEFLPFWGVRRGDVGRKMGYPDYGRVARTAFLDGRIAAHTPDLVWFETGIKGLDDAIAGFCRGPDPEPFLDPVLIDGIRGLVGSLPASGGASPRSRGDRDAGTDGGMDRSEVRQQVLTGTWMTKFPLPRLGRTNPPGWFSTAARHALGGVFALPHGAGSCVALPEGLRFHAKETRARQAALAAALGWAHSGGEEPPLGPGLSALLAELGVPTTLGEWDVDEAGLDRVAEHMLAESPALGSLEEVRRACERLR